MSKRLDSVYRGGPSHDWQKTKCEVSETFAIAGYGVDDNGRIDGIFLAEPKAGHCIMPAPSIEASAPAIWRNSSGGCRPSRSRAARSLRSRVARAAFGGRDPRCWSRSRTRTSRATATYVTLNSRASGLIFDRPTVTH